MRTSSQSGILGREGRRSLPFSACVIVAAFLSVVSYGVSATSNSRVEQRSSGYSGMRGSSARGLSDPSAAAAVGSDAGGTLTLEGDLQTTMTEDGLQEGDEAAVAIGGTSRMPRRFNRGMKDGLEREPAVFVAPEDHRKYLVREKTRNSTVANRKRQHRITTRAISGIVASAILLTTVFALVLRHVHAKKRESAKQMDRGPPSAAAVQADKIARAIFAEGEARRQDRFWLEFHRRNVMELGVTAILSALLGPEHRWEFWRVKRLLQRRE